MNEISQALHDLSRASHSGAAFLAAFGFTWLICGVLAYRLSVKAVSLLVLFQAAVALPAAFGLERVLGFPPGAPDNPLTLLAIYLAVAPGLAVPAVLIAYRYAPHYVPAAFSAVVGAHFLPYAWLQQSRLYLVLAVVVAWVPFVLMRVMGERGFRVVPLFVGGCLLAAAVLVRY